METGHTLRLDPKAFGLAAALISAAIMLVLGFLGWAGLYMGPVRMMMEWHIFFSTTPIGIIAGMAEAAIVSFVFCYAFAWLYNRTSRA